MIEEGLGGRTTVSDDPVEFSPDKNGARYLPPCLHTHKPLDVVAHHARHQRPQGALQQDRLGNRSGRRRSDRYRQGAPASAAAAARRRSSSSARRSSSTACRCTPTCLPARRQVARAWRSTTRRSPPNAASVSSTPGRVIKSSSARRLPPRSRRPRCARPRRRRRDQGTLLQVEFGTDHLNSCRTSHRDSAEEGPRQIIQSQQPVSACSPSSGPATFPCELSTGRLPGSLRRPAN